MTPLKEISKGRDEFVRTFYLTSYSGRKFTVRDGRIVAFEAIGPRGKVRIVLDETL